MSPSFSWLIADARLALRSLQRNPGSALLALISIALGIGLATALFSAVDAFVLRPFPFRAPGELWTISSRGADQRTIGYGWADVEDMRRASENFGTLVAYQRVGRFLAQGDASSFGLVHIVDAHFFSTLGVRAQLGHADVTPGADGTPRIVLGHRRWQRQFGGDPAIIGQTITVNHHPHLVAGVMPLEFEGVMRNVPCDAWIDAATWISQRNERTRRSRNDQFEMFIRLAPGVSPASAAARLDAAIRGPDAHQPVPAGQPGTTLERNFTPSWQKRLLVSGGLIPIALLLLLVTCANAAQLRLMELEQRRREFAVRIALGSNPLRLAGGVLVETLLLGLVATVAGLLLAQALIVATEAAVAQYSDYMVPGMRLDWRAAVFCGFAMLGALLLAGLAPTRQALRLDVNNELKTGSGTGIGIGRFRRVLIAGQAAAL